MDIHASWTLLRSAAGERILLEALAVPMLMLGPAESTGTLVNQLGQRPPRGWRVGGGGLRPGTCRAANRAPCPPPPPPSEP